MRLSIALAFSVLCASASAQDAPARVSGTPKTTVQTVAAATEKTIIYKSPAAASPRCDSVIDDKALRELVQKGAGR